MPDSIESFCLQEKNTVRFLSSGFHLLLCPSQTAVPFAIAVGMSKKMPEVDPVSAPSTSDVDIDAFALNLVLTKVFQDMLKKPDSDDDADQGQASGVANEINKPIAAAMAQAVTGFGL